MVGVIEERFKIRLSEEDIEKGEVFIEWSNGFGSTYEVFISRRSTRVVYVTSNFKGDRYKYLNGAFDVKDLKKALRKI